MPDYLFDFQKHLVQWALRRGRAAISEAADRLEELEGFCQAAIKLLEKE